LIKDIKDFLNLTIPQIVIIKHFYYKQMMNELKAGMPAKKQTTIQATKQWEEFRKGLING
jgi:hypothetical protein